MSILRYKLRCLFFFNDTATTEIYTLSLHDALPISEGDRAHRAHSPVAHHVAGDLGDLDRKSTRLNSSHLGTSYAVFCLKKKTHAPLQWEARALQDLRTKSKNAPPET